MAPRAPKTLPARKLRRTKRTGHEAVAAADTGFLADQNDTVFALIDRVNRAYGDTRCIRAVHTGNRDRFFSRFALFHCNYPAAVYADRNMVAFFTGNHTATAVDAALGVT